MTAFFLLNYNATDEDDDPVVEKCHSLKAAKYRYFKWRKYNKRRDHLASILEMNMIHYDNGTEATADLVNRWTYKRTTSHLWRWEKQ